MLVLKFTHLKFSLVCREDPVVPRVGNFTILAHCLNRFGLRTDWQEYGADFIISLGVVF